MPSKLVHPKYTPYGTAASRIFLPVINPSTQYETMGAEVLVRGSDNGVTSHHDSQGVECLAYPSNASV